MATLRVSGLEKRYGRRTVLHDVSLALEPGQIHGLLGPNGSGKTTALHIIAGLIKPNSGSVEIAGILIEDKASRHHFGFAPDDLPLPASLTGQEYLKFHDSMRQMDTTLRSEVLIEALGLEDALYRPIAQYSHGMKRKVQLIAALSHEPELLILDEPFRGLDPEAAAVLLGLLDIFTASGRAVLIATHDMLRAHRDCDTVTILSEGVIISQGAPNELVKLSPEAQTLEDVFMNVTGLQAEQRNRQNILKGLFNPIDI